MTAPADADVERVARAIYSAHPRHPRAQWQTEPEDVRVGYCLQARAALAAMPRPGSERADALEEAARTALEFTNQHINPMFPIDYMRGVEDGAVKIVAAIRALKDKPLPAQGGWQPIETAPRDGTDVLLYSPDAISDAMIGHWVDGFGPPGDGGAWWPDNDSARFPIDAWPTHWQPLPPPPEKADE